MIRDGLADSSVQTKKTGVPGFDVVFRLWRAFRLLVVYAAGTALASLVGDTGVNDWKHRSASRVRHTNTTVDHFKSRNARLSPKRCLSFSSGP